jgi:hypothetical protein
MIIAGRCHDCINSLFGKTEFVVVSQYFTLFFLPFFSKLKLTIITAAAATTTITTTVLYKSEERKEPTKIYYTTRRQELPLMWL